jgi:tRNA G18 (ribose-2'-O)-methylase SpoU
MPITVVDAPDDPRLAPYVGIRDPHLLREGNRFVAEGRLVVQRLVEQSPDAIESVVVTAPALAELATSFEPHLSRLDVLLVDRDALSALTGYDLHRGCVAIARRPAEAALPALVPAPGGCLVVLEAVANPDNVGGIFRNALAFGASGVALDPASSDPLYRKAVRTSMGAALAVPFARLRPWPEALDTLRAMEVALVALTTADRALDIEEAAARLADRRVALVVGNEGSGVSEAVARRAEVWARVPIAREVDSLNAATAAGIALYVFGRARTSTRNRGPFV